MKEPRAKRTISKGRMDLSFILNHEACDAHQNTIKVEDVLTDLDNIPQDRIARTRYLQNLRQRRYRARKKSTLTSIVQDSQHQYHMNLQLEQNIKHLFDRHLNTCIRS